MAVSSVAEPRPRRLQRIRILPRRAVLVLLAVLVLAALAVLSAFAFDRYYADRVLPGVSVAGIDATGLTSEELTSRLQALTVAPEAVEIASGDSTIAVPSAELGRRVDIEAAVTAALAAGRVAGPLQDVPERLGILRDGRAVDLAVTVDRAALAAWVEDRARAELVRAEDAQIIATATGWVAMQSSEGRSLDEVAALTAIEAALTDGSSAATRVELPLTVLTPDVDTLDAELAIAAAKRVATPFTVYFRDDATWTIPAETLRAAISFVDGEDRPIPVVDTDALAANLAVIAEDVARPADETLVLKSKSGAAFGFVPGKNGRYVDTAATAALIGDVLAARAEGTATSAQASPVVLTVVPPELTAAEAAASTHQVSLVGGWTTRFTSSESNGFGNNIRIPAKLINGTVVGPGQVFDFWKVVGPVTFARGFKMGGIIEGGQTNPTGAIGGGICSASTTIFNAALRAGYQILERDQHAFYIPRYPLGLDATVSKYGGQITQNMRFRNDTPHALYIRGLSGPGWVRFEIYSVPNGRTVSFSSPSVTNVRKATDQTVQTASLKKGTSKRVEYPSNGMNVVVLRTVRNANGAIVHSDRFVSSYIRVNGLKLLGTS